MELVSKTAMMGYTASISTRNISSESSVREDTGSVSGSYKIILNWAVIYVFNTVSSFEGELGREGERGKIWQWHMPYHWVPGLTFLIWLAQELFLPFSLEFIYTCPSQSGMLHSVHWLCLKKIYILEMNCWECSLPWIPVPVLSQSMVLPISCHRPWI